MRKEGGGGARLLLCRDFRAQAFFLFPQFGRELGAEILGFEHLTDFDFRFAGHRIGATLHPFDRFFLGLHLQQPEAGDQILRLRKRTVDDRALAA